MADNTQKVGVEVEVKGAEKSISSIKDLKTAIKDARNEQVKMAESFGEGSDEYVKASKKVAELKDKVDDLNDSTKSLGGTGLERASSGMQQFGEGLKNLDFQKVKVGLTAMKTAFAAVGIGLIVQLVSYLIENFDSLSQGSGGLAKSLRFVADIMGSIVETGGKVLNFFTDLIGISSEAERAVEAQGEAFVEASKNSKDAIASQSAEYDRLIGVAKASGKSTVELEIAKQQAIIDTNKALLQQALTYLKNGGQLDEAKKKLINDELEAIKTASSQIEIIKATESKRVADVNLKRQQEHNANLLKEEERFNKEKLRLREELEQKQLETEAAANKFRLDAINEQNAINNESTRIAMDEMSEEELQKQVKKNQDARDLAEREKEGAKLLEQEKYAIALNGLNAIQQVTDVFFAFKSSKLKKGSAEELELAKKAFNVNKALQLATATVTGIQAVQGAFATATASPITAVFPAYPFIQAGIAGVLSAANIAKIAASKFEGGGGSPSTGGGGGGGGASIPAPPTISNQNANVEGTQFDENGKRIGAKNDNTINVVATVGVDEITAKTNRVNVLEKQSTF